VHCTEASAYGKGSNDQSGEPDVVMVLRRHADAGVLAAVSILREHLPDLKIRWSTWSI